MNYCEICTNDSNCNKCYDNFDYDSDMDLCSGRIENCEIYYLNGSCLKCEQNHYIIEYNRNNCAYLESLVNYYSKDSGINYFLCDMIYIHIIFQIIVSIY